MMEKDAARRLAELKSLFPLTKYYGKDSLHHLLTKEHLGITLALKMPFFVVLTKIDLCPENIYQENVANLFKILKSGLVNRMPILIKGCN